MWTAPLLPKYIASALKPIWSAGRHRRLYRFGPVMTTHTVAFLPKYGLASSKGSLDAFANFRKSNAALQSELVT